MVNILYNNMNNRLLSGMVLPYVVCGVRERQSLVPGLNNWRNRVF